MMLKKRRPNLIRLWRLGLLVAAVLLIREAVSQRGRSEAAAALQPERLRGDFPEIHSLGTVNPTSGWRAVLDSAGQTLGYVTTTAPESEAFIGYAGPSHCLLVFDAKGTLTRVRLIKSYDTSDHVAEVVADRAFFTQFPEQMKQPAESRPLHIVTGATLTSAAMAQGVLAKLGKASGTSLRFPDEITLAEVQHLEPKAAKLQPSRQHPGSQEVLDAKGQRIGIATRTSPVTDTLVGYKGPTDSLMLLDSSGLVLKRMSLRKSYDTKRYLAYVTGDDYFQKLFNDMTLEKLADLDFKQAKIEGVSGATETSWSIAEGLKLRAKNLLEAQPTGWLRKIVWRWQDTGHILTLIAAFVMAFSKLRGIAWARHLHHFWLVLYGGFVASELLSQGLLTGWAAHGTPWQSAPGLLMLAVISLLGPIFTSKQLYCHHICPHGALQQLVARRLPWQWRVPAKLERWLTQIPFLLLALIFVSLILGWAINLNSLEPFDAYVFRVAGWASLAIALIGLIASLFQPLAYCKYACPTGALFKLVRFTGDADRLGIRDWIAAGLLVVGVMI
ncbi:MAG: 4Fe-4S binding protein [Verrucomicrobia bacterium]|nr:4Fe-4S binding protein [Verrucomicrobiota bacterium]